MQLLKEARIHVVERDENPLTRPHCSPPKCSLSAVKQRKHLGEREVHSDEQPSYQNRVVKVFFQEEVPRTMMIRAGQCARAADWYGTSMMVYLGAKEKKGTLIMHA